jgi:hypothetical protein
MLDDLLNSFASSDGEAVEVAAVQQLSGSTGELSRVMAAAVGGVGPFKGRYDLPDSAVPSKAVVAGPKGYETARAFIKAAGNDPVAIGTMLDQALAPLRKPGALLPSGALKPAALEKWKSDFAPALRALDEVNPGFSRQFDNAARATELMVEAGAMALAQLLIMDFTMTLTSKKIRSQGLMT